MAFNSNLSIFKLDFDRKDQYEYVKLKSENDNGDHL